MEVVIFINFILLKANIFLQDPHNQESVLEQHISLTLFG